MSLQNGSINQTRVLQKIWLKPGISRIEISEELDLNKSTITKIVTELTDQNLIIMDEAEGAAREGSVGRRPIGMHINKALGIIAGIEVRTDQWNLVLADLDGTILLSRNFSLFTNEDGIIGIIDHCIAETVTICESGNHNLLGIGVGLSGIIDPYSGTIIQSNPLRITERLSVTDRLGKKYPFPILIENDANCCCWSELIRQKENRDRNFLCVLGEFRQTQTGQSNSGIAVGLGFVIKGSVLHGDNFSAGEFQSAFKAVTNPTQFNIPPEEVEFLRVKEESMEGLLKEMSRNIAFVVNILNMTKIIFFSDICQYQDKISSILSEQIQENWSYDSKVNCRISYSNLERFSVAHGAASMFIEWMFTPPPWWEFRDSRHPFGIDFLKTALIRS